MEIMVDLFWPHPFAKDDAFIDHKCHKREMIEIPSLISLYDNTQLKKILTERYKDYESGRTLVAKVSCLYGDNLFPEKVIIFLKAPMRIQPLDYGREDIIETTEVDDRTR